MRCEHEGCSREGMPCFLPDDDETPSFYFCVAHAHVEGFCWACGNFFGGIDSFDFGPGYCDNCAPEFEDWDDDDWGAEMLDAWEFMEPNGVE